MSGEPQEPPKRERLEVPSTTGLERRLLVGDAAPRRPRRKPAIKPVPQSALLGRLQAFLPTLQAANNDLRQQLESGEAHEAVAMERASEDEQEGPYVQMDLACGLFDLKDEAAVAAAERALVSQGVAVEAFSGGSSSDSSDDGSSSENEDEEARNGAAGAAASPAAGCCDMQEDAAAAGTKASARRQKRRGIRQPGIEELS